MAVTLSPQDRRKLDELRRVKFLATSALGLCLTVLVVAKVNDTGHAGVAAVAAFAEAAAIGGLADWYAVVALFKRPLGLPIPHTEIIPRNQDRIADNLGQFIEENFLDDHAVRAKLADVGFADAIADWLDDPERAEGLVRYLTSLVPQILDAVEETDLRDALAGQAIEKLRETDLTPVAIKLLDELTRNDRHHKLLNEVVDALDSFLANDAAIEAIRQRVAEELPSLLYIFRADAVIVRRILTTAAALLQEVKARPDHELRGEYETFFRRYVNGLRRSRRFARALDEAKTALLDRPEIHEIVERLWQGLRDHAREDAAKDEPAMAARLTGVFAEMSSALRGRPTLRAQIDDGLRDAVARLAADQKTNVSAFVAEQVKSWDFRQLTLLIEANVGRDLQFIRFNGMIVGGLAGLALFAIERIFI